MCSVGNDYHVHLTRFGAIYELLKKASYYSAIMARGNYDCRYVTAL